MNDLMEKRLASIVERPWARQLWAMKPNFSSARQIASSPSFQFQLGMFSRWACGNRNRYKSSLCYTFYCLRSYWETQQCLSAQGQPDSSSFSFAWLWGLMLCFPPLCITLPHLCNMTSAFIKPKSLIQVQSFNQIRAKRNVFLWQTHQPLLWGYLATLFKHWLLT